MSNTRGNIIFYINIVSIPMRYGVYRLLIL
nr:MAG TPA: hypothetical protein [Caudoviricetes sp.]